MNETPKVYSVLDGPLGELLLTSDGESLTGVYLAPHKGGPERTDAWRRDDAALQPVRDQLSAYFAGDRRDFDLPLALHGTPFQRKVWEALAAIPFGETVGYAEIARRIGSPGSARAVGAAVGRNPVSIVVPCHRVVGSDGSLTGYGGGLDRKRWLLDHERAASS
jgi:methylated-DNA-[protein]-cysteine S-methyltransferase